MTATNTYTLTRRFFPGGLGTIPCTVRQEFTLLRGLPEQFDLLTIKHPDNARGDTYLTLTHPSWGNYSVVLSLLWGYAVDGHADCDAHIHSKTNEHPAGAPADAHAAVQILNSRARARRQHRAYTSAITLPTGPLRGARPLDPIDSLR